MNRPSYQHTLAGGLARGQGAHDDDEPDWEALKAQAEAASFEAAAHALRMSSQGPSALDPFGAPQAVATQLHATHDPFGHRAQTYDGFEPAPVFATPSLAPAPSHGSSTAFDPFDDEETPSFAAKGRPKWLLPLVAALGVVALVIGGNVIVKQQAAEAEREALRERMRKEMAAAASATPQVEEPTPMPTSAPTAPKATGSVAALLSKSVSSHGASSVRATAAIAPRGKQLAVRGKRQVQRRTRFAKPARHGARRGRPQDHGDGIPESSSNDPLLGL